MADHNTSVSNDSSSSTPGNSNSNSTSSPSNGHSETEPIPDAIPGDDDFPMDHPPGHHHRLLQTTEQSIYGSSLSFKIVIS